jgi:ADP-ribose pyrophosphatase
VPEVVDRDEVWPVLRSADLHRDDWVVALREDYLQRPGHPGDEPFGRLVLEHPGAVVILAVDEHDRVFCLWQYRHPARRRFVELPAGLLDVAGEDPLGTARRELVEEAGLEAERWTRLGTFSSSPGISAEVVHYFLAQGLREVTSEFERVHEEAAMETGWVPLGELRRAVSAGEVSNALTALAVLLFSAAR